MKFEEFKERFDRFDDAVYGKGGFKEVYRALHPDFGEVVVKVLMKGVDSRSQREIDIVRENAFERVPRIHDVQHLEVNGNETIAIVEQYIEGTPLNEVIASGKRYDLREATDFLGQSLEFIKDIAAKGIVHRDIKPNNIIVGIGGTVTFLDFGIARVLTEASITQTNEHSPFTPGYAAPEVIASQKDLVDSRADLFSIGVVTYELITGKNPFTENASNVLSVLLNTVTITPIDFELEGDSQSMFVGLVSSLMNKRLGSRPASAQQALGWLEAAKATYEGGAR